MRIKMAAGKSAVQGSTGETVKGLVRTNNADKNVRAAFDWLKSELYFAKVDQPSGHDALYSTPSSLTLADCSIN